MNSFCLSEPDASFVEILAAGRTNSWNDSTLTDLSADSSWEPKVLIGITHFRDNRSEFDSMKTIKKELYDESSSSHSAVRMGCSCLSVV